MIYDEIKKENINALKSGDKNSRAVYSIFLTRYSNLEHELQSKGEKICDDDAIRIIQKILKELVEEKEGYKATSNDEMVKSISLQEEALKKYLPKMLSEEEIKKIIETLLDKSIPSIMRHFKEKYASKVDMALVNKIARQYNS